PELSVAVTAGSGAGAQPAGTTTRSDTNNIQHALVRDGREDMGSLLGLQSSIPRATLPWTAAPGPPQAGPRPLLASYRFRRGPGQEKEAKRGAEIDTLTANDRGRATGGALDDGGERGAGREPDRALRLLRRWERSAHPPHRGADAGEPIPRSHAPVARPGGPGAARRPPRRVGERGHRRRPLRPHRRRGVSGPALRRPSARVRARPRAARCVGRGNSAHARLPLELRARRRPPRRHHAL